ncbi:MAG: RHS domain-containing protein [Proteobacteria bacterium]|nr:RHS domain-containing protein [Pseudomonadota bacterium]
MKIKIAEAMREGTTYAYDGNGNIIAADDIHYKYDFQNRLVGVTSPLPEDGTLQIASYSYDAQSRRVKKTAFNVTTYFIYDQFNNLIAESDASGNITREYIYMNGKPLALINLPLPSSAPPQTISQQVSGMCSTIGFGRATRDQAILFFFILSPFFGLILIRSYRRKNYLAFSGAVVLWCLVLGSAFIFTEESVRAQESAEKIYYFHLDHLGTPLVMTDADINIVWRWQYGPFGEESPWMESNTISQNLRFPGQYYDAETGLYYNFHRYYSPKLGRYLTPDPIKMLNLYSILLSLKCKIDPLIVEGADVDLYGYALNNPIIWIDRLGLMCEKSYWQRVWENFKTTNSAVPGLLAPAGLGLYSSGYVSSALGSVTLGQWAAGGFQGVSMGGATFTGLETGIVAGGTWVVNFALMGTAWEAGAAAGSLINAAITPCEQKSCD